MAEIFFSWILLIHIVDCDLACWMWLNELFLNFAPFGLLYIIWFLWSSSCFEVFCSYLSVHHRAKSKSFAWWFDGHCFRYSRTTIESLISRGFLKHFVEEDNSMIWVRKFTKPSTLCLSTRRSISAPEITWTQTAACKPTIPCLPI